SARHGFLCSPWCSNTIRTARSRNSGEYLVVVFMTPSSQELESPGNPGRFNSQFEIWKNVQAILNWSKRPASPIPPTSLPRISHPQLDGVVSIPESERFAVGREGD